MAKFSRRPCRWWCEVCCNHAKAGQDNSIEEGSLDHHHIGLRLCHYYHARRLERTYIIAPFPRLPWQNLGRTEPHTYFATGSEGSVSGKFAFGGGLNGGCSAIPMLALRLLRAGSNFSFFPSFATAGGVVDCARALSDGVANSRATLIPIIIVRRPACSRGPFMLKFPGILIRWTALSMQATASSLTCCKVFVSTSCCRCRHGRHP